MIDREPIRGRPMDEDARLREISERMVHWLRNSTYFQYAKATAAVEGALKINDELVLVIGPDGHVRRERLLFRLWRHLRSRFWPL